MDQTVLQERFIIFLVVWGALVALSTLFFLRTKDTARKQKMVPWVAGTFAFVFVGMTQYLGLPPESLFIVIPAVGMILYMNLRAIRFCPKCSAYNVSTAGLRVKHCRSCGEVLEKADTAR